MAAFVTASEYMGGLCDLTGEMGRVAVAAGTRRDTDTVAAILDTNMAVANAMALLVCR
jgi:predicted translin family RNA/ssDNA-binding protein